MSALDNLDVLEYRVSQLERMLEPLLKLVGDLDKKIALLAQKMVIATVLIGVVVNGVGVWYSANGSKDPVVQQLSVPAMSDADKIKLIQAELDRLKSVTK
jgi:hypothetical protein